MQNKGFVKVIAVLLTLICCFYFSFSFVVSHYEKQAAALEAKTPGAGQHFLDSMRQEKVYLGWKTLKQCEELQIGLGLDLKGGMNVILEVSVPDVVKALAGDNVENPAFQAAVKEANERGGHFVSAFVDAYQKANGKGKLAAVFAAKMKDQGVTEKSTDDQVRAALNKEVDAAVENANKVVRSRIDRFGVAQPNIQVLKGKGTVGQIMVEMPGIKEPDRVHKLLQGQANLEFWETYQLKDLQSKQFFTELDKRLAAGTSAAQEEKPAEGDSALAEAAPAEAKADSAAAVQKDAEQYAAEHPLLSKLVQAVAGGQAVVSPEGCTVGYVALRDTAEVMQMLTSEAARRIFPNDLRFAFDVKPAEHFNNQLVALYALRGVNGCRPSMQGEMISEATDDYEAKTGRPIVSMRMTTTGTRLWAELTRKNVDKQVAIVMDGVVYSAPVVNEPMNNGNAQISGSFTPDDTRDLANVLKSGKMPAPTKIVQEETVGPSLGAASIQAGFQACIIAFILLMIFMCCFYGFIPGMVANCALLLNFFFTFGVLVSYQAALTMSGIAGLVLSLGMAVDANVLIYERTKEELRAGKNIKQALADGYGNAFSAIFDSNLTSIITAIILYNVGTGPIRGFALTLGIGICASFFTAVWLTRIVYEHFLNRDKWLNLTFTTKWSRSFLQNTSVKFMEKGKRSMIVFACAVVVALGFLGVRGLSKGIDFTGGRNYVITLQQDGIEPEQVRAAVAAQVHEKDPNATVSCIAITTPDHDAVRLTTNYRINEEGEAVDQEVEQYIYQCLFDAKIVTADYATFIDRDNVTGGSIISSQKVGPSVADDMTRGAIVSVLLALAAIFIYILVRFRNVAFSIGSVVALTVDTLLIIGMYSICWGWVPFSLEVDQTFIGAVLTAIGYSINDKVVVFDRMRENLILYPTRERKNLFNMSLNSTLCRTIITSFTTLLVLLCIFFLGGDSIRSFSFAMILGVVFGTCSSIFLAAPIAYKVLGQKSIVKEKKQK